MPRRAKGIRLWLRPEEQNADGTLRKRAVWIIRDEPRKIGKGCAAQDRASAERARFARVTKPSCQFLTALWTISHSCVVMLSQGSRFDE